MAAIEETPPPAPSTMSVRVKASTFELREGTKAKQGDIIQIPIDESKRTPLIRWGLRSGNLVNVVSTPVPEEEAPETVIFDLPPESSTPVPEEKVEEEVVEEAEPKEEEAPETKETSKKPPRSNKPKTGSKE